MPPVPGGYQQPPQSQPPHLSQPNNDVDASTDEVWVETKAGDGKSYYYHSKTRETTWTKPEGPNVKILSQQQVSYLNILPYLTSFDDNFRFRWKLELSSQLEQNL